MTRLSYNIDHLKTVYNLNTFENLETGENIAVTKNVGNFEISENF